MAGNSKIRLLTILLGFCSLVVAGVWAADIMLRKWSESPILLSEPVVVEVSRGISLAKLSHLLAERDVVSRAELFQLWVRLHSDYSRFQAGKYRFEETARPVDIARMLSSGDIFSPVVFEYTIPEGFTVRQTVERLLAGGIGTTEEFNKLTSSDEFRLSLDIPGSSLEGYLFPATYRFVEMPTAEDALRLAVETFWKRLPTDYQTTVEELGFTLDQAVVLASLIELETPFDDEKPIVSEVIQNRLKARMAIAIDASIIYGIPDYQGRLTNQHLRDRNNPYNTRVHPGLPPTAIGSPGTASLLAVINPADTGYYYYVLDLDTGRHYFSKSYKEHQVKVRKLVADIRRRRAQSQSTNQTQP